MIEQISVPLSSQISPSQEQPSQEEYEPSPFEIVKVDNIEAKPEENQELVLDNSIVKETTNSKEVIVKDTSNEQQEDNKETENNNSVTDDNNKDPLDIESAQSEIYNILNNNTTNIENETDCQKTPSPSLSYVVDMDPLPQLSISSQVSNKPLQRLEYDVIHATGWDENYPPHQLLPKDKNSSKEEVIQHGKGWQSERQCTYPQEIILQVSCGAARIRKLQILSHHYKIATKLEIYIGSVQQRKEMVGMDKNTGGVHDEKKTLSWDKLKKVIDNDGMNSEEDDSSEENDYDIIRENTTNAEPYILFRRLGYCALDNNERANYKARELKSVRLDAEGEYIRLVARRCHENHLNQYNQVGIVGITVMGEPADYLLAGESQKIPIENADEGLSRVESPETCIVPFIQDNYWMINDQRNFTSLYSILPNPSLSVPNNNSPTTTTSLPNNTDDQTNKNYNPVIANDFLSNGEGTENLLAAFGRAKQNAVKVEDFNLAKVLKYCTEIVKKAAEEVQKFERLKKQAVEEEDFDNAEQYKHEIEALRAGVRGTITDEGLDLDDSGEVVVCDSSLQDIIGLADDVENEISNHNITGVPSGNEHQFQQDHYFEPSVYMPKSRTNSNVSMDRSGARAPEPMFPKSRTNSDASVSRYLGGNGYNNYTYEQQQEFSTPTTPTCSTTPLHWTPFVDDRSIPALTNSSKADSMMAYPPQDELAEDEPEPLSNLARSAFALSISFFGEEIISYILCKKFASRESALTEIIKRIDIDGEGSNIEGIDKVSFVKAGYEVLREVLGENREELALQVLTLWEKLIKFCVHHQIPNSSTWRLVDNNYELLLNKIADSNVNIKQSSVNLFILLARTYRTPTQSVLSLILKPAKTSSQPLKKAKPTVELIIRLVEEFGVILMSKGKFDKDNKLSLEAVMEVSVSYLNHNNEEVQDSAVKLVVEVIKRVGRGVGPYLTEVKPLLLENILNLVTEWEEETGNVAGEWIPRRKLTEEEKAAIKNYEVDESMLQKPLAKRGTVSRIEQQLMELRYMMNNTHHIIKEDYDTYLANTTKALHQEEIDEEDLALAAEEALLVAELAELEQAEAENNSRTSGQKSKAAASKKTSTGTGSKSAAPSKTASKKTKDDGKAAPSKKTSTSKSSAASSKGASKLDSRRGSTDDKSAQKGGRKNSVNLTQGKLTSEPEKIADEPSDRCCIFCDEHDERFTEENLVSHYWNDCPVLTNCRLCNIILEISTLDDHMLNDCDKSKFVKQCPRCREVIEADDYLEHMAKQSCITIRQDIVRCPLCKTVVKPATEQGWKSHLLDESGCTKNRRKSKASTATSMVKEMEAAATAGKREKKSTSATKSSATSKTPARKPTVTSKDKPKKASTTKVSKVKK